MRDNIPIFLVLFNRLKNELNNSPKNLKWLPNEKPEIVEICYQLNESYRVIFRKIAENPDKSFIGPSIFKNSLDEYKKYYKEKVEIAARPLYVKYEKELENIILNLENQAKEKGLTSAEFYEKLLDSYKTGSLFNPTVHNAASLLADLFCTVHDIVDTNLMPDVFTDEQIGALDYFENVIGVNFYAINKRWGQAPNLLISENIKKKTDKLIELYNEAVKCYIFGMNAASVVMCRSLLEYILIEYYKIPKDELYKIVALAEAKYKKLKSLNLYKLRKDANDIMHECENKSKIEDETVLLYLSTIRELVFLIPEK